MVRLVVNAMVAFRKEKYISWLWDVAQLGGGACGVCMKFWL